MRGGPDERQRGSHGERGLEPSARIALFSSPDVAASLGRPGLLEDRVGARGVIREPAARSDVLLQRLAGAPVPELGGAPREVASWLEETARTAATREGVRLVVMSVYPDLAGPAPWRHRESGWLVQLPDGDSGWSEDAQAWFEENFDVAAPLSSARSIDNIAEIARSTASDERSLLVFTVSTYDPTDRTHSYGDVADTFALRTNRTLAMLEQQAAALGITVVDVDGAVAELGAAEHVIAPGLLTAAGAEYVTEEAIAAIDQSGALGGSLQAPVMRVTVPAFDRRTTEGTLLAWHVAPGDSIKDGDALFDVRFDSIAQKVGVDSTRGKSAAQIRRREAERRKRAGQVITVSVFAGSDVHLHDIVVEAGDRIAAGDVVAVATTTPSSGDVDVREVEAKMRLGLRAGSG